MQEINHIVVPVDLDRHTEKLMEFAVDMANKLDSGISFFHGVEFEYGTMGEMVFGEYSYEELNAYRVEEAKKLLEKMTGRVAGKCRKECSSEVSFGYVVDEIINYARERQAGLIIIGTHGRRGMEKVLLGSVAERVIKNAPCPTLVMNPYRS